MSQGEIWSSHQFTAQNQLNAEGKNAQGEFFFEHVYNLLILPKSFGNFLTFNQLNLFSTSWVYHPGITTSSSQTPISFCSGFLTVVQRTPPTFLILNISNSNFNNCIIGNNSHLTTKAECRTLMQTPEQEMQCKFRIKDNKIEIWAFTYLSYSLILL